VDQDSLGLQGVKVSESGDGLQVWSKALSIAGERAVLLLNRTGEAASMTVSWSDLGLADASPATVKDVWARKDLGAFNSSYSATVPALDAVMVIVRGSEGKMTTYTAGGATVQRGRPVSFTQVASRVKVARIQIAYTNPDKEPRFAELRVNGRIATRIEFPSTGNNGTVGAIWIESLLDRAGAKNELSFSVAGDPGPAIESISVE